MAAHLPIEMWRLILRQATYIPDLLSVSWDYDPSVRIWEGWEPGLTTGIEMGLGTKCAVVRVCREWKEIGVEFLYEAIYIPWHIARLDNLIKAFTASAATAPSDGGYGWWTKRIVCPYLVLSSKHFERLFIVLDHCHNLEAFTMSDEEEPIPPNIQMRLIGVLESRFSHSLRRVEFNTNPEQSSYPNAIPRVFGLTSLGLVVQDDTPDLSDYSVFEHITTLTVHLPNYIHEFPSQWDFPSLRNLSLRGVSGNDVAALVPFLVRHQDTLLHFHIATMRNLNYDFPSLLSSTPRLRSLAFDKRDLNVLENSGSNTTLTSLTHLGLTHNPKKDGYTPWHQESLKQMFEGGLFPILQVIRILEMDPVLPDFAWRDVTERCGKHGVRLEDQHGNPIRLVADDSSPFDESMKAEG